MPHCHESERSTLIHYPDFDPLPYPSGLEPAPTVEFRRLASAVTGYLAVGKASVMRWLKRIERKPSGFRRRKLDLEGLKQDLRDYSRMPISTSGRRG